MADPLKLVLADGRPATLLAGDVSTVLSIDGRLVSSWDLGGRPYALVREDGTYRRGLNGGLLQKREARADAPRVRRRLAAPEGASIVEAARAEAVAAAHALRTKCSTPAAEIAASDHHLALLALERLRRIAAMDTRALQADAERFLAACGPVGILPPDQYLSLVVRVTEGCSWNACSFCRLYADIPFRVKTPAELVRHATVLRDYFGPSLALRRAVFLGDANALSLGPKQLIPLLEVVATSFPGLPLVSFVDAWTGRSKTVPHWTACRALGLRRVYLGLESGDPELLAWLGKPGSGDDALRLVHALHEAGLEVGVIVLVGAGGERFFATHVARSRQILAAMSLGPGDIVYLSEYVDEPALAYGCRAGGSRDLEPLPAERSRLQREAIAEAVRRSPGPRLARYDLREFVY